jgi:hypothetical protein|tara:strand:+ start:145 stop:336 length:192 start_codon:yes stop_codon:yes gene_type:complete
MTTTKQTIAMRSSSSSLFALLALTLSLFFVQSEASAFLATDKNFDSAVLGSNKNVFVKFLAPW